MTGVKTPRLADLLAMPREEVEAIAARLGIRPGRSKAATARAVEQREFDEHRTAQKIARIGDIF